MVTKMEFGAIIVYFIICLLISFLALISMNIRILSGILFLIASITYFAFSVIIYYINYSNLLLHYSDYDVLQEEVN